MIDARNGGRLAELVGPLLESRGLTLGVAESCTGGMLASRITDVPGSSAYFTGGVVAYDNLVKEKVLGVSGRELERHGAVSEQVAKAMAAGIKELLTTDIGISVTGLAGPGGGAPGKPVGLVYVALDHAGTVLCKELRLKGSRLEIRTATVSAALDLLYHHLLQGKISG